MTLDLFTGVSVGTVVGGVLGLLVLAGAAWWSLPYIKRRINREQWRWERTALRVRALFLPTGPRREIVRLRLTVHDNLAQTQRVLRQPGARDAVPPQLHDLLPPLERLAASLDRDLRLWQSEPHGGLLLDAMPELRERGHTLIAQAVAVRARALPVIHDADRLNRGPTEHDLRSGVDALNVDVPAITALDSPVVLPHNPPLAIAETAPYR